MLEYKIILPDYDNNGEPLQAVHLDLQNELAEVFGGFTMVSAQGVWISKGERFNEDVIVYTFACNSGTFQREQNITIERWIECRARELCREARQQSVYIAIGSFSKIIEAET